MRYFQLVCHQLIHVFSVGQTDVLMKLSDYLYGGTGFGHIRLFLFREIWLLVFVGDNCIVEWHLCVIYEKVFSFASSLVILGKVICNCIIREQLGLFCKKSTYVSSLPGGPTARRQGLAVPIVYKKNTGQTYEIMSLKILIKAP